MSSTAIVPWISQQLIKLLGFDDGDEDHALELAEYVGSMQDEQDLRSYLVDLVGDAARANTFVKNLLAKRRSEERRQARQQQSASAASLSSNPETAATPLPSVVAPLPSLQPLPALGTTPPESQPTIKSSKAKASSHSTTSPSQVTVTTPVADPFQLKLTSAPKPVSRVANNAPPTRPKQKFISFMDRNTGQLATDLLPGRRFCECLASKHALVNNCLQCGRIVCEQEGIGPCLHCGACVVTSEQQQLLARDSKQAKKFLEKLMRDTGVADTITLEMFRRTALQSHDSSSAEALALATARRDQLLDFDRNMAKRTHVIDDQADYFNTDSNKWQSRKERDAARKREQALRDKQHEGRRSTKMTFDFAGRQLVEEAPAVMDIYEEERVEQEQARDKTRLATARGFVVATDGGEEEEMVLSLQDNPMLDEAAVKPVFQLETTLAHSSTGHKEQSTAVRGRLQDKGLSEMVDGGMCMSMHQPWASLLVYGIKMHEGRVWSSSHRGRLWIAAASKVPAQEDLDNLEEHYRQYYAPLGVPFPKEYPTACLLGYVDVEDVLPQDEYREKHPKGDSSMPFVFVCKNPHELIVRYPVKGEHKIWKLDKSMHDSAKKCVTPVDMSWLPDNFEAT
eukprot:m.256361 g.256361  ORF g.256361 m.256361 type:complete len:624 (+) comp17564_c0_seq2:2521-4392(+)